MAVPLKPLSDQVMMMVGDPAASAGDRAPSRRGRRQGGPCCPQPRSARRSGDFHPQQGGRPARSTSIWPTGAAERLLIHAIGTFGRVDTSVNDAAAAMYARVEDVSLEGTAGLRRRYVGLVEASLVAARHLRPQGGAIINIGSVLSNRAIPLQGLLRDEAA